jgi:outer membrane protein assembly factor BamE (lipoprotein component of BamABCDE complex)
MVRVSGVTVAVLAAGVLAGAEERMFRLGLVQRELKPGLSQAEVVEKLGSPNILTRDAMGREAWVYDRVASEYEQSNSGVGVGGGGTGAGSTFWGIVGVQAGKREEKARTTQRTLTVVVRFSGDGVVESFSWHDSRF